MEWNIIADVVVAVVVVALLLLLRHCSFVAPSCQSVGRLLGWLFVCPGTSGSLVPGSIRPYGKQKEKLAKKMMMKK